ncbi:hypothetical protein PG997_010166 [Apiospora hydei]|uniref:Uncharacterized protein n=1 Tax=Apiospora hydei TaxID=1337664 RepID=A0ABR1VW87_9PEZI
MPPIDPRGQHKGKREKICLGNLCVDFHITPAAAIATMQPEEESVAEEKDGLLMYPEDPDCKISLGDLCLNSHPAPAAAAADSPPNHEETAPPAAVSSGEAVVVERRFIPPHCGDPDGKPDPSCPFDHARLRNNGTRHGETQEVAAEGTEEGEMEEQALIPPFCKDPEHQDHRLCPGGRVEPIDHNRPPSALKMMFTLYPNITTTTAPTTPTLSRVDNGDAAASANATTTVDPNYKINQWEYDGRSMKWAICFLGAFGLFAAVVVFRDFRRKKFSWFPMPWDKPVLNAVANKLYRCKDKVRGLFSKGKGNNDEEGQQQQQLSEKGQGQAAAAAAGGVTVVATPATPAASSFYGTSAAPSAPSVSPFDAARQMEDGAANDNGSGSEGEATLSENVGVLANYNTPAAPAPATTTAGPAAAENNGEPPAVPAATFARPPRLPSLYVEK